MSAFHAANLVKLAPRCYSPLGLFAHCDGNIIGGILLGVGMALASSCPGTVLAQIGSGLSSGQPALVGAILGGLVWAGLVRPWLRSSSRARPCPPPTKEPSRTVHESLGINRHVAAAAFEAALAVAVAVLTALSARGLSRNPAASAGLSTARRAFRPVAGGLLIGLAQLASLLMRRSAVGVSAAYEEAGDFLWWPLDWTPESERPPRPAGAAVAFAAGVVAGAWALTHAGLPAALAYAVPTVGATIPVWRSVLGGFVMVLGARIAGGCTSGHGITGMSLLSVSSFVTIGSALAAGVFTAKMFL